LGEEFAFEHIWTQNEQRLSKGKPPLFDEVSEVDRVPYGEITPKQFLNRYVLKSKPLYL